MESWAHAAACRRLLRDQGSSASNSPHLLSSSSDIRSGSQFSLIPRECEPAMSRVLDDADEMLRRALPKGRMPHVCVIGAGMAGLRCAEVLSKKGVKVTILEGRDRIGGRLCQSNHLGHVADLGPNWIHGTDNNPMLDLAKQTNTVYMSPPVDAPQSIYDEHGKLLDQEVASQRASLVWETVEEATQYSKDNCSTIPPHLSLMDFFKKRLKEKKLDDAATKQTLQIALVWGDIVGEPIETQSLKYFWLEECVGGENLFLAGTYQAILNLVAKSALANVDLRLNTRVTDIHTAPDAGKQDRSVCVSAQSQSTQSFDEVVVTAPLGWLKQNLAAFHPPLPPRLTKSVDSISYGRLEKVYITFPMAFWLKKSGDTDSPKTFHTQFLAPAYAKSTNPSEWPVECVNLAALPSGLDQPTLLFYINGPCAAHVTSLLNPSGSSNATASASPPLSRDKNGGKLSAADRRILDFFHPYYSRLPNYSASSRACHPTAVLATDWIHDDLAGNGSYTLFQTSIATAAKRGGRAGCPAGAGVSAAAKETDVEFDKDIIALRLGCPKRGLWFAGEHTAPFVALGTVTGAYWSGEAVARRVLGVYGLGEGDGDIDGTLA